MAIFRGVGGSGSSSDNSFLDEVTAQATIATNKATEASTSATTASTKADEALASANSAASSVASLQNNSISSAAFNTGDGVLTLTKLGGATVTADLDGRFLTSETDPVFTSHVAHGITATNISQWDTAYGWGDHSTQGYITDITTQSDPKYLSAIGDDTTTGTITAAGLSTSGNVVSSGTCQANLLVSTGNTNVAGTLTVIGNYNSLNGNINLSGGSITLGGTVDGRNVSTDGNKLDGIEANATADQTGAEIKSAYEAVADTNAFTDSEKTKLSGIEASADVTDTVNVTAAGALMDSEVTNLAQVKAFDSSDYATAAQGSTADSALQNLVEDTSPQLGGQLNGNSNSITNIGSITASTGTFSTVTGSIVTTSGNIEATGGNITAGSNIVVGGTVDGVDIAARDAVLTSTTTTANSAMQDLVDDTSPQLGGNLDLNGNNITGTGNISGDYITAGASGINSVGGIYSLGSTVYGNTLQSAGNTTVGGNVVVTGTVDGRDVATDGARLDTIPYHRVKEIGLRSRYSNTLVLTTSYQDVGMFQDVIHPSTPVDCSRYLDLRLYIDWRYVSSAINDLDLQIQFTVPPATTANLGSVTVLSPDPANHDTGSYQKWGYVSGDHTHHFTEFGKINKTGTASGSPMRVYSWYYNEALDRTYFLHDSNPGISLVNGDTVYWHPYDWETAGTTIIKDIEIDTRYLSFAHQTETHKVKIAYDDSRLTYRFKLKERSTSDSAVMDIASVTFTDVGEI